MPTPDRLCRRRWPLPRGVGRARMFVCHGTHEHSGRYAELAAECNCRGIELVSFDFHGHGRREGVRGDIGPLGLAGAIADAIECVVSETAAAPLPVLIFGHSLGSLVAFLAAHQLATTASLPTPAMVILHGFAMDSVSPPFGVTSLIPVLRAAPGVIHAVCRALTRLQPNGPVCPLPPPSELTHDAARAARALADPLMHHGWICNRTGLALMDGRARCQQLLGDFGRAFPFLLIQGGADELCPRSACDALMAASPQPDKALHLHEGLRHEVLNEAPLAREKALRDLFAWVVPRMGGVRRSRL